MQVGRREALALAHPGRVFWLIAIATFLLDQASKSVVRVLWSSAEALDAITVRFLQPAFEAHAQIPLLGEAIALTHVRNEGAAFGMFPGYQPIFMLTSAVVILVVIVYWFRAKPTAWPVVVALALIGGGSLGNLVDRALLGRVTDFIYVAIIDFPVFNLADSAIFVGVGILVMWLLFGPLEATEAEHEHVAADAVEAGDAECDAVPDDAGRRADAVTGAEGPQ